MDQSTLGKALMKIGIQIGVHTGTLLNTYIKRKTEKNQKAKSKAGSISTAIKSEEEKNSDKSKKTRISIASDNSALSKKRNAKIVSKYVQKSKKIEKDNKAKHDSLLDQHASEQDKGMVLNKSMCDDAISSSFFLNTTYTPKHLKDTNNEELESEGLLQV